MSNGYREDFGKYTGAVYGDFPQSWTQQFGLPPEYSSLFPNIRPDVLQQLDPSTYNALIEGITSKYQEQVGGEMSDIGSGMLGGILRSEEFKGARQQEAMTPLLSALTQGYEGIEASMAQARSQVDRSIADNIRTFLGLDYVPEEEEGGGGDGTVSDAWDDPMEGTIPSEISNEWFDTGADPSLWGGDEGDVWYGRPDQVQGLWDVQNPNVPPQQGDIITYGDLSWYWAVYNLETGEGEWISND